jgi:hypothetical protein
MELVERIVRTIQQGSTIAINCHSGRGRTGTLSAMVAAKLRGVRSVAELVDVIVQMRESRDGLVETPEQFAFLTRMLALPMGAPTPVTAADNPHRQNSSSLTKSLNTLEKMAPMLVVLVLFVSFVVHWVRKDRRGKHRRNLAISSSALEAGVNQPPVAFNR